MIRELLNRTIAFLAIFSFTFYICWNVYFTFSKQIPPSILYKLTGIPSPTTGMYRSFIGLMTLNKNAYFSNNPFLIPFLLLLIITIYVIVKKAIRKQPVFISNNLGISYFAVLILSEFWMLIK
ncbi:MAG: DUF2752 domain-containing protein [Salinivirgaceae bacterium]